MSDYKQNLKYEFLTSTELEFINNICFKLRRSADSRKNLFYILANFSNCIEKSLFEVSSKDAYYYTKLLRKQLKNHQIQENYCCCIFLELRKFYEYAENTGFIQENPFQNIKNPFHAPEQLSAGSLPALDKVDQLLSLCEPDTMLYLAVLLAFRMALPISEITELKKTQICSELDSTNLFIRMERHKDKDNTPSFLYVPEDLRQPLKRAILSTDENFPYVLQNKHGRPYATRSLQNALSSIQKESGNSICFSNLRSLSIYLMLIEKIPVKEIASYVGVEGTWLTLYDHIPNSLQLDASKYVHLRVKHTM